MQVLANPTADIQEGPKVTRAELKARGVRPYDEKVCSYLISSLPALMLYMCTRKNPTAWCIVVCALPVAPMGRSGVSSI